MHVVACVKWVELNPDIDQLHGTVEPRPHGAGFSDADLAAVESALRLAEQWDARVEVVCVGPADADRGLRELLAAGADRAVRVQVDGPHGPVDPPSSDVARLIAATWPDTSPDVVICGEASLDRGSGSVPAFLAHQLGAAQALGLVEITPGVPGKLSVLRRLDGGRRERVVCGTPVVLSVEGSVASLRRASLAATLAAREQPIEVRFAPLDSAADVPRLRPWRPRPRMLPGPAGDDPLERIVALTGAFVDRTPPRTEVLAPPDAARAIVEQLREWGYLPQPE